MSTVGNYYISKVVDSSVSGNTSLTNDAHWHCLATQTLSTGDWIVTATLRVRPGLCSSSNNNLRAGVCINLGNAKINDEVGSQYDGAQEQRLTYHENAGSVVNYLNASRIIHVTSNTQVINFGGLYYNPYGHVSTGSSTKAACQGSVLKYVCLKIN